MLMLNATLKCNELLTASSKFHLLLTSSSVFLKISSLTLMILSRSFPASSSSLFNTIQYNYTVNSINLSITALQNINWVSITN